jgi:hypothetical protein
MNLTNCKCGVANEQQYWESRHKVLAYGAPLT